MKETAEGFSLLSKMAGFNFWACFGHFSLALYLFYISSRFIVAKCCSRVAFWPFRLKLKL